MVLVGHCTRNDCALAPNVAIQAKTNSDQNLDCFFMAVQPPSELLSGHTSALLRTHTSACLRIICQSCLQIWVARPDVGRPFFCVRTPARTWSLSQTAWCHTTSVRNLLFAACQTTSKFFLPVKRIEYVS